MNLYKLFKSDSCTKERIPYTHSRKHDDPSKLLHFPPTQTLKSESQASHPEESERKPRKGVVNTPCLQGSSSRRINSQLSRVNTFVFRAASLASAVHALSFSVPRLRARPRLYLSLLYMKRRSENFQRTRVLTALTLRNCTAGESVCRNREWILWKRGICGSVLWKFWGSILILGMVEVI